MYLKIRTILDKQVGVEEVELLLVQRIVFIRLSKLYGSHQRVVALLEGDLTVLVKDIVIPQSRNVGVSPLAIGIARRIADKYVSQIA